MLALLPLLIKTYTERGADMARITTDLCIIGAGSGGLSLAAGAAQMGARVVLIEGAEMGGDCLNTGCVPSKALLAAAKAAQAMRDGAGFGVTAVEPQVDFAAVKRSCAARHRRGSPRWTARSGSRGWACR